MQQSPAFSSFRKLMDVWDATLIKENKEKSEKQGKVRSIIDGKNLIMFFKNGNSIFGAPEESRIVFARMKSPDINDEPENWEGDARFNAFDLVKALGGNSVENLFSMKDLPNIDVITRDEAEGELMKCPCQDQSPPATLVTNPIDKMGANVISLKDRE